MDRVPARPLLLVLARLPLDPLDDLPPPLLPPLGCAANSWHKTTSTKRLTRTLMPNILTLCAASVISDIISNFPALINLSHE